MLGIDRRSLQNFDWALLVLVLLLVSLGIANLISATHEADLIGWSSQVHRQLVAVGIGFAGLLVVFAFDYRHLERFAIPIFVGSLLLVASTLVFGPVIKGNQSWLVLGPLRLQPSEFSKIALVIALSRYFHRHPPSTMHSILDLWKPSLVTLSIVGVIILQRDKGVALITLLIACTYLPLLRISLRAWLAVAGAVAACAILVWLFALEPYQHARILDFLDPGRDPLASGYQVNQSRIAVGSGGLFGKGYMGGTQTQLRFLPTQHTDFIFSVLAEEWGFVGSSVVLGLYTVLLFWGLAIARQAKESFGALLAVGIVGTLFWPALINIAMVLGLAPVIGVAFPFFSYGGSAMIASLIAAGILLNISMRRYMF